MSSLFKDSRRKKPRRKPSDLSFDKSPLATTENEKSDQTDNVASPTNEVSLISNLFPSFNLINYPTRRPSKLFDGESVHSVDNEDTDEASLNLSVDSGALNTMMDELFDHDNNLKPNIRNPADKNFYSNYYQNLVEKSNKSGAGSPDAPDDFLKYIQDFKKEYVIENKLRKELDKRKALTDNLNRKNVLNVINNENYLSENFYDPLNEVDLSDDRVTTTERSSSRRQFLNKKSLASFGSKNSPRISVSDKKKESTTPTILRRFFTEDEPVESLSIRAQVSEFEAKRTALQAINPFKFTSPSISNSLSVGNLSGHNAISVQMEDDLSVSSSMRTHNIDDSGSFFSPVKLKSKGNRDSNEENTPNNSSKSSIVSGDIEPARKDEQSNIDNDGLSKLPSGTDSKNYGLHRKLKQRHLQMIALSGTLGVGLYLSASKNFLISGPFGALLGFVLAGLVVMCAMLSLGEMISFIPLVGGVSGIGSRFVDDAFGFAVGVIYWVNYVISLPSEITAGTIMLSYYDTMDLPGRSAAGWITFFLVWTVSVNLLDVRVYGELEFVLSILKLAVVLLSVLLNIIINTGGMPPNYQVTRFKYWDSSQSEPEKGLTYGFFRPTFDLTDNGTGSLAGIGGNAGRFLSVLVSCCIASYAFVGTEIVVIVAGEAKNPRRALPSATKKIFWRILVFYVLAIFCVSINFYSGDPRLLRYRLILKKNPTAKDEAIQQSVAKLFGANACTSRKNQQRLNTFSGLYNGNQSPWIIAFQNARQCSLSSLFNGLFVVFALSAGSSQLYASSRTLYQLAVQGKAPSIFTRCSKQGVPYVSVLFSGVFGTLAYLCIENDSNNVFQRLMTICAASGEIVWACMCLAFIRYYYGLKHRTDLMSRDSPAFPYRAPLQPYLAYFGLVAGVVLILTTGITVFLKDSWSGELFVTSYGSVILFVVLYFGYKFIKGTKILKIEQIQLDIGRKELDKIVWEETKAYSTNVREKISKFFHLVFG